MNKQNKFEHLSEWCEAYHAKTNLKVHPSSVPVDVVLDDLMGNFNKLIAWVTDLAKHSMEIREQIESLRGYNFGLQEHQSRMDAILSNLTETKLTKERIKVDKKEGKK